MSKRFFVIILGLLVVGSYFAIRAFTQTSSTIVILSDIHLANEQEGRWPQTTPHYQSFIDSLSAIDVVFNVGDFTDNVVATEKGIRGGDFEFWKTEADLYANINARQSDTLFLHSYGSGHDWNATTALAEVENYTGIPRQGTHRWNNVTLVWLSTKGGTFPNQATESEVLEPEQYRWLDETLARHSNVILLWHVPIRTDETFSKGQWNNNHNLTIPPQDNLYPIINKHKDNIVAIINGHIHQPIKTKYDDIPVFICPFFGTGCHCEVQQSRPTVSIAPQNCGEIKAERYYLNLTG